MVRDDSSGLARALKHIDSQAGYNAALSMSFAKSNTKQRHSHEPKQELICTI
ncbi:hypothetical protein HMPREF9244_00930 [Alloscardovia omnicolens F0580]|uniref:Uncharacterized protein n=1 Tax=Alloscardovia omnicolens F0580 TaxID=1321816 RepID=U1SFL2_9BIFI|nr:hypothetical protein HMPREF9244_00930 [Alloscardovia omnicolens F0580]